MCARLSVCLSECACVCAYDLFVRVFVCACARLYVSLFVCDSVCAYFVSLCHRVCVCVCVCLCVCLLV